MCTCSRSLTVCSSKSKNRWGNWYLGHPRPGSALCEGETDVNELLSCGWRNGILCSYLTYPPSSSPKPGIQTAAGGSCLSFLEAKESFGMATQMP